jgi:hypothetical protein
MALVVTSFMDCSPIVNCLLYWVDLVGIANLGNGLDPFLIATADLREAVKEAITMAENAFNVMTDHAEDKHVSAMLKLTLGGDAEYQAKFEAVKGDSQIQ